MGATLDAGTENFGIVREAGVLPRGRVQAVSASCPTPTLLKAEAAKRPQDCSELWLAVWWTEFLGPRDHCVFVHARICQVGTTPI